MKSIFKLRLPIIVALAAFVTVPIPALAQQTYWKYAPAYKKEYAENVLDRSTLFIPLFGAVYRAKFEVLIKQVPNIRGVVIHNHGCGGQWGWETTIAQFYYRNGFAVVTPEFVTRPGNKLGCPGGTSEEMLQKAGDRYRDGVFTARNPARIDARGDDNEQVLRWIKSMTTLPVFLSGHSEGCRTVYHWNRDDPQVKGGICHKQSLTSDYEHLWRWDTKLPMWSSMEDDDPWATNGRPGPAPGFERKFRDHPENLTNFRYPGNSHDPLIRPGEPESLRAWLDARVTKPLERTQNGFNYETVLPAIQEQLQSRPK